MSRKHEIAHNNRYDLNNILYNGHYYFVATSATNINDF